MSLKFNADELAIQPIEITINGKSYITGNLTVEKMQKIQALNTADKTPDALAQELGILLDVSPDLFRGLDIRKLAAAAMFITKNLSKEFEAIGKAVPEGKNV